MNKNTLNTLKQLKVMNLRIVSFEQHEFSRVNGRPRNFNLSTIKIMCEMGVTQITDLRHGLQYYLKVF